MGNLCIIHTILPIMSSLANHNIVKLMLSNTKKTQIGFPQLLGGRTICCILCLSVVMLPKYNEGWTRHSSLNSNHGILFNSTVDPGSCLYKNVKLLYILWLENMHKEGSTRHTKEIHFRETRLNFFHSQITSNMSRSSCRDPGKISRQRNWLF